MPQFEARSLLVGSAVGVCVGGGVAWWLCGQSQPAAQAQPARVADSGGGLCAAETPTSATARRPAGRELSDAEFATLSNEELVAAVEEGRLKDHQLESKLGGKQQDCERAVAVRRSLLDRKAGLSPAGASKLAGLPYEGYVYNQVLGANCEVVVGYVPLPCGLVGPLLLDGVPVFVPMATTEGCLVASTNRGAKAISQSPGGAAATILKDGITRAPCLLMGSAKDAAALKAWCDDSTNWASLQAAFEATTSFGKLRAAVATVAGRNVFLRLTCFAGDAMGMNMVSKGTLAVVAMLQELFDCKLVSISGNLCSDKKPAAINWVEGRGKSVVVEAVLPKQVVEGTLKTTVAGIVDVAYRKNLVGSAMAGAVGGFNAHAANIVAAVFLASGQDPAQVVESANCITLAEAIPGEDGEMDLHISVTMPSIEVGTVGGGTSLPAQAACLELMGCRGAARSEGQVPGDNARHLGKVVGAATLAGELSLMAALATNELVKSHMQHNRKKA